MYRKLLYILFRVLAFVAGYMSADREIDANSDALYQGENTMQKDLLLGNMGMTYEYSNRILPDFPLADSDGKNIFFSQLMGKENKLVFRISSNNCSSCIDFTVECLKSVLGIIPPDRIVVLVEGNGKRALKAFATRLDLGLPLYYMAEKTFYDYLDRENVPFFFISNSELRVEDLFIPIKEIPEHAEHYFRAISKKYFL